MSSFLDHGVLDNPVLFHYISVFLPTFRAPILLENFKHLACFVFIFYISVKIKPLNLNQLVDTVEVEL